MKKYKLLLPLLLVMGITLSIFPNWKQNPIEESNQNKPQPIAETSPQMANPASEYCLAKGGNVEIVTNNDGSQTGMCQLGDYACEEWIFYRGECDLEADALKIQQALVDKGLSLDGMEVKINKHMGRYIGGSVVPISEPAGGGYVFAVKEEGQISILADGNGIISCSSFDGYPDYPSYLVAECIDDSGNPVTRK